jgi:ADP-heptose:LPS heptosyltransferase
LGDLAIAAPFIQAAVEKYAVTLLAKPFAVDMGRRFWPGVEVVPFTAPWTAFRFYSKYGIWNWPWAKMIHLRNELIHKEFDFGVSGRWDPRDHFCLKVAGVKERLGFPRLKSQRYLTRPLTRPDPLAHRVEYWRIAGTALGLDFPATFPFSANSRVSPPIVLIHTGARSPLRVWPLENFQEITRRLRQEGYVVQIACDDDQLEWWERRGEAASSPPTVTALFGYLDQGGVFIGNDSGPGHLAARCGMPTLTLFGPQLHEWFVPLNPAAEWVEGKACPYKPCSDYCRYEAPHCLWKVTAEEVWPRALEFVRRNLGGPAER